MLKVKLLWQVMGGLSGLRSTQTYNIQISGESARANVEAVVGYPVLLVKITQEERYKPKQIMNVDETALSWK